MARRRWLCGGAALKCSRMNSVSCEIGEEINTCYREVPCFVLVVVEMCILLVLALTWRIGKLYTLAVGRLSGSSGWQHQLSVTIVSAFVSSVFSAARTGTHPAFGCPHAVRALGCTQL